MGVFEPSNKLYLTGEIEWPLEAFGDAELKLRIKGLMERYGKESKEELRAGFSYSAWRRSDELNFEESAARYREAESEMIRRYNFEIRQIVADYEVRVSKKMLKFDTEKSCLVFNQMECEISPNSFQQSVCKYMFELHPSGEFVNTETLYEEMGNNPNEFPEGHTKIRWAALEVNKKTNTAFGFPIFKTPTGQIAIAPPKP